MRFRVWSVSEANNANRFHNVNVKFYEQINESPNLKCWLEQELPNYPLGEKVTRVKIGRDKVGFVLGWNPKKYQPIFENLGLKNESGLMSNYWYNGQEILNRFIMVKTPRMLTSQNEFDAMQKFESQNEF